MTRAEWLNKPCLTLPQIAQIAGVSARNLRGSFERGAFQLGVVGTRKGWFLKFSPLDAIRISVAVILGRWQLLEDAGVAGFAAAMMAEEPIRATNGTYLYVGYRDRGPVVNRGPALFWNRPKDLQEHADLLRRPFITVPVDALIADVLERVSEVLGVEPPPIDGEQSETSVVTRPIPGMELAVANTTAEMAADPTDGVTNESSRNLAAT